MITQNEFTTDLKLASFPQFVFSIHDTGSFFLSAYFDNATISHKFDPQSLTHIPLRDSVLVCFGSSFKFRFSDFGEYNEFCDFVGVETFFEFFEVEGC